LMYAFTWHWLKSVRTPSQHVSLYHCNFSYPLFPCCTFRYQCNVSCLRRYSIAALLTVTILIIMACTCLSVCISLLHYSLLSYSLWHAFICCTCSSALSCAHSVMPSINICTFISSKSISLCFISSLFITITRLLSNIAMQKYMFDCSRCSYSV
jgi:hypothetical protein